MAKSQLLSIDTRDDRLEIWTLLHRLPPADRLLFVGWACAQAPQGKGRLPAPVPAMMRVSVDEARRDDRASQMHTNECYTDLLALLNTFDVDAMKLACELERRVTAHYRR
jgi:hypothetical protein